MHPIRSAAFQGGRVDPANRDRVLGYVERHLPGLVPEPYAETTCLFTSTPDEAFVVDRADGVTVLSACSVHGAKFAPCVGRADDNQRTRDWGLRGLARIELVSVSMITLSAERRTASVCA